MRPLYYNLGYDLLVLSSVLSIIGVCVLAYGYRASLFSEDRITKWFATSLVLLAVAYAARRFTWDVVVPVVYGETFYNPVNIAFNCINMVAVYYGLKARYLLISEEERDGWTWLTSWMHPGILQLRPRAIIEDRED